MNPLFPSRAGRLPALGALAAALALSACTTGPDYRRPEYQDTPLRNVALLQQRSAQTPAPALDHWWDGFDDPVLSDIIQRVLAQNLDLSAAFARVEQAQASARIAGARRLPEGELSGQAARARQSLQSPLGEIASGFPGYQRTQNLFELDAGASWELDLAGALKRGAQAADAELQAAQAQQLGVRISVEAEAADAYFRIRGAQARIALAEHQVKASAELGEIVRLRLKDGLASVAEIAQADARLAQSRAALPPLRIELERQTNRLDVLMGAAPGTYAQRLSEGADTGRVPAIAVSQSSVELMRRRPDVIAAERRLAASNERIGQAMAAWYPDLSLSALLGFQSLGAAGFLTADSLQAQGGLGLRWRLFDFGRIDAEIARAEGAHAEALALYRKSMLTAVEDVANAIMALVQLEQQSRELAAQVDAQQRARGNAEQAYQGGVLSLAEVLTEDRLLLAAQDQMAQVHADNARAAVSVFRALGGGW
ncbi:efflux transporter outer membrane subunit [Herbaspirillum sp. SJZ099]|uniref:efflux transporter outer membrane subunit n=1 Tax=Herbaspirillum sp. SJZ099 TaxID=2572916 RepID=UPI0011A83C5E|nr:efflux transporter outer membrane subunit [Herbaspirillum sp. SJZ099]TWC69508.1 NodT family efflux transporter outer membrane factor (OMF) lipoprotein [Herbaspirillum sp. SJZ099]